jgi:hypothetical protein
MPAQFEGIGDMMAEAQQEIGATTAAQSHGDGSLLAIMATLSPASRVAMVTPMPALPPPSMTTSKLRVGMSRSSLTASRKRMA